MLSGLFHTFNPILYQSRNAQSSALELWYFKHVVARLGKGCSDLPLRALSVSPGIIRSGEESHAFVHVADGLKGTYYLFRFPQKEFRYRDSPFELRIGKNRFSLTGVDLDLENEEVGLRASIAYGALLPPRSSFLFRGVMGPYNLSPSLHNHHEIGSLDHDLTGTAEFSYPESPGEVEKVSFDGGKGYIEKNWGRNPPIPRLWIQTNSFDAPEASSLSFSTARVSKGRREFNGLLCVFVVGGVEYRFTTYTGAELVLLEYDTRAIRILLRDKRHKLEILVRRGLERYPFWSEMPDKPAALAESLDASARVILKSLHGSVEDIVFDSCSHAVAVEIAGDIQLLKP